MAPYIVHSVLCALAFATTGVLSSRITGLSGDEVLVSSNSCGIHWVPNDSSFEEAIEFYSAFQGQRARASLNYAQECYFSNGSIDHPMCKNYVRSQLPYTVERNASCPFRKDICRTQTGNIRLDTGLLDSHWDLGLNSHPSRRLGRYYTVLP